MGRITTPKEFRATARGDLGRRPRDGRAACRRRRRPRRHDGRCRPRLGSGADRAWQCASLALPLRSGAAVYTGGDLRRPRSGDRRRLYSVEMPYFLRTLDSLNMFGTTRGSEDEALRDAASGALVAFAKTGSPTTQAVDWPEFDNEAQEIVIFDTGPIETREIPYREGLDFFRQQRFGGWRCRSGHLFRSASACPRIPTSSDTESWPGALPRASVLARCPKISRSRKRSAVGAHRRHFAPSTRAARPLANLSARVSGR